MIYFDSHVKEYYLEKRECVIGLPEALLPSHLVRQYQGMTHLAFVEIAGRDSVAAAVKAVEKWGFTDLIPTYAYTGTEFGTWKSVEEAIERLERRLPSTKIHPMLVLGSPRFWHALNGRFIDELVARYGFYMPCVGCHIYLHSVRIPLAILLGRIPIISGEREQHDGAVKINQVSEALNSYEKLSNKFGIRLLMPLRNISEGEKITDLLGFQWDQGDEQLGCVLSSNYKRSNGEITLSKVQVKTYLDHFAYPLAEKITESYVRGRTPDHLKIAKAILET